MEDNYLWDRSGEPDQEVQELEEILGTLRYQPQRLEIPVNVQVARRRSFVPAMAIAAAIALLAVLFGLWFSFNRRQTVPVLDAKHDSQIQENKSAEPPQVAADQHPAPVLVPNPAPSGIQKRRAAPRNLLARNVNRSTQIRPPGLTTEELAEKEQVLTALRLVSAKLNLAQRKTQGIPQLNMIRNQHKIG